MENDRINKLNDADGSREVGLHTEPVGFFDVPCNVACLIMKRGHEHINTTKILLHDDEGFPYLKTVLCPVCHGTGRVAVKEE